MFIQSSLYIYPRKVAQYTQASAITLYKEYAQKGIQLSPYGYKSYAHLFYSKKEKPQKSDDTKGNQFPVYVITILHKQSELDESVEFEFVEEKNGFLIYKKPNQK